ncbi:MAG: RNA 2',3'-cyclic phosphodiesterase [Chitinivibrionales bacterium]|nr:RNA 2',3'-cyclic phosphodiesterase [Chitinivibrionales bacterium]
MYRLFIALDFSDDVKEAIAGICFGIPHVRWMPADQIHLTLRFIGEVDKHLFEEIKSALYSVHATKFKLSLKGTGYFPPRRDPRVLWVGVENNELLLQLFNRIEQALHSVGCEPEKRKFHPHITIGRLKEKVPSSKVMPFVVNNALFSVPDIAVDQFFLYSSNLTREEAIHTKQESYSLIDPV